MSVFSIWEMRFAPPHVEEGRALARAVWSGMRRDFAGYLDHELIEDLDEPGHLIVVSRWESRDAAMATRRIPTRGAPRNSSRSRASASSASGCTGDCPGRPLTAPARACRARRLRC